MTKHMSSQAAKSNAFPGAANDRAPIRVLAVDPSPMIRLGLEIWIRDTPGIELVGQAADGARWLADVSASFGYATCPEHASDPHTLFRLADEAQYRAKRSGSGLGFAAHA